MESSVPQETSIQPSGVIGKVRERLWKVIEKDALSQKTQKQWAEVSRAVAAKLDSRSLARVRMLLTAQAEAIGKLTAISGNAMDIILGTVFGAVGTRDIWASFSRKSAIGANSARTQFVSGILKVGASPVIFGVRPLTNAEYLIGRGIMPLSERVATIVNTIALKKESKRLPQQVFVGSAKA